MTQETGHLEATLAASKTALAVMEGESSATRACLVESDARIAFRIFRRKPIPPLFCSVVLLLTSFSLAITALTEELEVLQLAGNNVARALNARGDLVVSRLQDIPIRAQEIALHGVRHGTAVALIIAQVNSRHDL